jgi:hypothetical protein
LYDGLVLRGYVLRVAPPLGVEGALFVSSAELASATSARKVPSPTKRVHTPPAYKGRLVISALLAYDLASKFGRVDTMCETVRPITVELGTNTPG